MERFVWQLPALISLLASLTGLSAGARAETRPRYGGRLTVEIHDAITLTDPAVWPPQLVPLVYDSLVKLDERGVPLPALAVSWQHDPENKRWEFRLRPGVKFHDGSPLNAAAAAACLKGWSTITAAGDDVVVVQTETPAPDLPARLTGPGNAILRRGADGVTTGSGPFRIAEWQPGRRALLAANDDYWSGRPYLDEIEVQMGRSPRDQAIDLELGKADLVELTPDDARRASQRGARTWVSSPAELLALVFERGRAAVDDARLRQAVALSIDRGAIHNVLLLKQGESTGALLPAWLTGYAFLFPAQRDLERARQKAAFLPKSGMRITLAYDAGDPLARPIAERIALNAREAGVIVQVAPGGGADVRLVRVPVRSFDPAQALAAYAAAFGMPPFKAPPISFPEANLHAEQKLLEDSRIIPLFHLPQVVGLGSRVRNWNPEPWGDWRLDGIWLDARRP
ncbi:MAG TPA: ABC transporter substrate-binding protein [Ktedonobacterales bacterium]|nr:ABC transporter substrate-binding protein [Ktedonobacterales bacterium]